MSRLIEKYSKTKHKLKDLKPTSANKINPSMPKQKSIIE